MMMRGTCVLWSLTAVLFGYGNGYAEDTLPTLPRFTCTVTASYGYFPTYSPPPAIGSKVQIDIAYLTKTRGAFDFASTRRHDKENVSVIPYREPFTVASVTGSPDGQLIRLVSSSASKQSLRFDIRYRDTPHQKSYGSLLYEMPIVAGICFLECLSNP